MAMTEAVVPAPRGNRPTRQGRRRPFSTLMKKLANFKGVAVGDGSRHTQAKLNSSNDNNNSNNNRIINTKHQPRGNYPYLQPTTFNSEPERESYYSLSTARSERTRTSGASLEPAGSVTSFPDGQVPPAAFPRSAAPTVSTDHETSRSTAAPSHRGSSLAGTSRTANGMRCGDSTFSSPAPSVRSLTTTLTTIQSLGPNGALNNALGTGTGTTMGMGATTNNNNHHSHHHHNSSLQGGGNPQIVHFNQPFPTTSSPASAIPVHLTPSVSAPGHPTTYTTATANNLLTDNASILTLASSSKRHRRRSFDTDASVRALAPSSLFGGSRESLPLSVLSANIEGIGGGGVAVSGSVGGGVGNGTAPGLHRAASSMVATERTSIYSATGILAAPTNERNSFYTKQQIAVATAADGASIRSGLLGHGRADSVSINGSVIGMTASSPLASSPSPREFLLTEQRDREKSSANGFEAGEDERVVKGVVVGGGDIKVDEKEKEMGLKE